MIRLYVVLCTFLGMVGCASIVKTYDVSGNIIGSCTSQSGLLSKKMATCMGQYFGQFKKKWQEISNELKM